MECESVSSEKVFTTYFECGKCFIGELVIIPTTMRNIGENGKFFIMSEVDWASMKIEVYFKIKNKVEKEFMFFKLITFLFFFNQIFKIIFNYKLKNKNFSQKYKNTFYLKLKIHKEI